MRRTTSCLAASLLATQVFGQANFPIIPPGTSTYVGAWIDTSDIAGDTCAAMNARMGLNFPIQMLAQSIPLPVFDYVTGAGGEALYSYVAESQTDAAFYLTIYADQDGGLSAIQDSDLVSLGVQLQRYENLGRQVFLRFLPEMGGAWQKYGLQPTLFKSTWIRMYEIVKQLAPKTVIVWSPNSSYGYPSGTTLAEVVSAEDKAALDTNNDGQLTNEDDAFSPYYPGDQYLDWAGVSLYYKGPGFQNLNQPQPGGYCEKLLHGFDAFYPTNYTPFYDTYCGIPNRPCFLSESGAAYHVNVTGGSTQLEMQEAWWNDCLFNSTFNSLFPMLKSSILFEHAKYEYDGGMEDYRDYRLTNDSTVLAAFQRAAIAFGAQAQWSNSTLTGGISADTLVPTTAPPTPGATTTEIWTTSISALNNEAVTFTSTAYTAAYYETTAIASSATGAAAIAPGVNAGVRQSSSAANLKIPQTFLLALIFGTFLLAR